VHKDSDKKSNKHRPRDSSLQLMIDYTIYTPAIN